MQMLYRKEQIRFPVQKPILGIEIKTKRNSATSLFSFEKIEAQI
jgi:hypothetical protein